MARASGGRVEGSIIVVGTEANSWKRKSIRAALITLSVGIIAFWVTRFFKPNAALLNLDSSTEATILEMLNMQQLQRLSQEAPQFPSKLPDRLKDPKLQTAIEAKIKTLQFFTMVDTTSAIPWGVIDQDSACIEFATRGLKLTAEDREWIEEFINQSVPNTERFRKIQKTLKARVIDWDSFDPNDCEEMPSDEGLSEDATYQ